jgi:hypothetical protein
MIVLALLTLVMRLVENAWLVLPGMAGISWAIAPLILAASLAMSGLGWIGGTALRRRENADDESGWVHEPRSMS